MKTDERAQAASLMTGIGQPLKQSFQEMLAFLKIVNHDKGLNIGARHIPELTSGIIPKIDEFADEKLQINFAISSRMRRTLR